MAIALTRVTPEQHFTQPPPRFTEASLVKELEERGIGRPSTYASILSTIVDRGYIEKKEGRFFPTELGTLVNELLVESFPRIVNVDFTAHMEADLDEVEDGQRDWRELLGGFYEPFKDDVEHAKEHMRDVKREEIPTDFTCEKCGSPMVIKWGRNGSFLACQGYPDCRNTKEITRSADGTVPAPELVTRADGSVYVCGIGDREPVPEGPDEVSVDRDACDALARMAGRLSGALGRAEVIRRQACYRPICADAMPVMGPCPRLAGAYVATGHNCWGMLNAPGTGLAMSELVVEKQNMGEDGPLYRELKSLDKRLGDWASRWQELAKVLPLLHRCALLFFGVFRFSLL